MGFASCAGGAVVLAVWMADVGLERVEGNMGGVVIGIDDDDDIEAVISNTDGVEVVAVVEGNGVDDGIATSEYNANPPTVVVVIVFPVIVIVWLLVPLVDDFELLMKVELEFFSCLV